MTTATELKPDRRSAEEVEKFLDYTEGLDQRHFRMSADGDVEFLLDREGLEDGNGLSDLPLAPHPNLTFRIGSDEFQMTNEAVAQAFRTGAPPAKLVDSVPLDVTEPLLNWKYRNKGKEFKALLRDGVIISFCLPGTEVYSTRKLLDSILVNMVRENASIVNFEHNIRETAFTVLDDTVSERLDDGSVLTAGVHFQNSLVGNKPLQVMSFVLRSTERHTGGEPELFEGGGISRAIQLHAWDRTLDARRIAAETPEEAQRIGTAYDFVAAATGQVLGTISEEFHRVTHLSEHTLDQRVGPYLDDIIKKFKMPQNRYQEIMQEFAHSESNRSALDLWMAFGHVGLADLELDPRLKRMMFETAGEIARNPAMCSKCHRSIRDTQG